MVSTCFYVTSGIALLCVIAGSIFLGLKVPDKIIDNEVNDQMTISSSSKMYSQWIDPPPPIYMQYYIFNVSNPEEVINGDKPNVTELGPYTYHLHQPRFDVTFYQNDSISYKFNHTLTFMRNMSVGEETDVVTALNIPLVTVVSLIKDIKLPKILHKILEEIVKALGDADLFKKLTIQELLFGYTDPVFDVISGLLNLLGIHSDFSKTFGIFYGYNNSDDGVYLVHSGKNNLSLANKIIKWNGAEELTYWTTEYGNMINGTDGTFFYHDVKQNDSIQLYTTDLCRSLTLNFEKETSIRNVDTLRFHMTAREFANISVNPDNIAFCVPNASYCFGSGLLNIGPCKQNAPILVSSPHFYMSDPKYINGVIGMDPNKENHETILDIEPFSGSVFQAKKRLQININLVSSQMFPQLKNIRSTVFPVLYLNESVYIDYNSAKEVSGLFMLMGFIHSIPYIMFGLAVVLVISLFAIKLCKKNRSKSKYSAIVDATDHANGVNGYGAIDDHSTPSVPS